MDLSIETILLIIGGIFALLAAIVALTPTKEDDRALDRFMRAAQRIAALFGRRPD